MELVEYAAAREAMEARKIEERKPLRLRLIFLPNMITLALGGGFNEKRHYRNSNSGYRDLSDQEWRWMLDFVIRGKHLRAYDHSNAWS